MTVFVSGELPGDGTSVLRESFDVVVDGGGVASDAFAAVAGEVRGIVALLTDRVDAALLARCPALRVVANVAVGIDNVDLDACRARGIVVTNTPDVLTEATADFAFGLLLAAARRIAEGDRLVRAEGRFPAWTPTFMLGTSVHGMTLGIIGMGRIGKAMARRARGFGMRVIYTQRRREPEALERALGAAWAATIDDLLPLVDAVTLHCPLTAETRGLLSRERLSKLRRGAVLVNTARGPIVDEAALADRLEEGAIAAAGLDVFEAEPRVHPKLLALPNVVLAPHIASADRKTREAMANMAAANVHRVLSGHAPLTPVS